MAGQREKGEPKKRGVLPFLKDMLCGTAIGVAFIIPGFSGGSVAAVLGVYERIVGAVADLFKEFRKNILILLPIALGMFLGAAAFLFPVRFFLSRYPIPTVCLFAGLALGGVPTVTERMQGRRGIFALIPALALSLLLCFLPQGRAVDLLSLDFFGYLFLFLAGAAAACALVVPGISGSMLLLIFGYYNPLVRLFTDYFLKGQSISPRNLLCDLRVPRRQSARGVCLRGGRLPAPFLSLRRPLVLDGRRPALCNRAVPLSVFHSLLPPPRPASSEGPVTVSRPLCLSFLYPANAGCGEFPRYRPQRPLRLPHRLAAAKASKPSYNRPLR